MSWRQYTQDGQALNAGRDGMPPTEGSQPGLRVRLRAGSALQLRLRHGGDRARQQERSQGFAADAAGVAAAGTLVLGGLLAVPGGEWAPEASSGLASGGV